MRSFSRWLLREEQKDFFEYLFACAVNLLFLILVALVLWPLSELEFAVHLAKGYWVFWSVVILVAAAIALGGRVLHIGQRPAFWDVYLMVVVVVSAGLQAGWSAFAAITFRDFSIASNIWIAATLCVIAFLSCYVAYLIVSALFNTRRLRLVNLILALASFIVFTIWPQVGRLMYGWFFDLF